MRIGFQFVPFPRDIWERSLDLSKSEFRLLGWFLSGLRWGIQQTQFSDEQILSGCDKWPPLGLSRNAMKEARASLLDRGLLIASQISNGEWSYTVPVSEDDTDSDPSVKDGQMSYQKMTAEVSNFDTYKRKKIKAEEPEKNGSRPTLEQVKDYCMERRNNVDAEKWFDYYSANGWRVGRNPMKDWKAAVRTWEKNGYSNKPNRASDCRPEDSPAVKIRRQLEDYEHRKAARQ